MFFGLPSVSATTSAHEASFLRASLHPGFTCLDGTDLINRLCDSPDLPHLTAAFNLLGPHWPHIKARDYLTQLMLGKVDGRSIADLVRELEPLASSPPHIIQELLDTAEIRGTAVAAGDLAVVWQTLPDSASPRYLPEMLKLCSVSGHNLSLLKFLVAVGPMQLDPLTRHFLLALLTHVDIAEDTARVCWRKHIEPQVSLLATDPGAAARFLNRLAIQALQGSDAPAAAAPVTCRMMSWLDRGIKRLYPIHVAAEVEAMLAKGEKSFTTNVWTPHGTSISVEFDLSRGVDGITSRAVHPYPSPTKHPVKVEPAIDLLEGLVWEPIRGLDFLHVGQQASLPSEQALLGSIQGLLPRREVHFVDFILDSAKAAVWLATLDDYRTRGYSCRVVPVVHGPSISAHPLPRLDNVERILHTGLRYSGIGPNSVASVNGSVYGNAIYLAAEGFDQGNPYGKDAGCSVFGLVILVHHPDVDPSVPCCPNQNAQFRTDVPVFIAHTTGRWVILRDPQMFLLTGVVCHSDPGGLAKYGPSTIRDLVRNSTHQMTLPVDRQGVVAASAGTLLSDIPLGTILLPRPPTDRWLPPSQRGAVFGVSRLPPRVSPCMRWDASNLVWASKKRALEPDQPDQAPPQVASDQAAPDQAAPQAAIGTAMSWLDAQRKRYKAWQGSVLRAFNRGDRQHARFVQEPRPAGVWGNYPWDKADRHYDSKFPPLRALNVSMPLQLAAAAHVTPSASPASSPRGGQLQPSASQAAPGGKAHPSNQSSDDDDSDYAP